jgi:hypothetical protein
VAVVMPGDIVIQTINIVEVAVPMPPVAALLFIVALRSQEVALRSQEVVLLPEAELLAARMSPTVVVADAVGNQ